MNTWSAVGKSGRQIIVTFVFTSTGSVSVTVVIATPVSTMETFATPPVNRSHAAGVVPNQVFPSAPSGINVNVSSGT